MKSLRLFISCIALCSLFQPVFAERGEAPSISGLDIQARNGMLRIDGENFYDTLTFRMWDREFTVDNSLWPPAKLRFRIPQTFFYSTKMEVKHPKDGYWINLGAINLDHSMEVSIAQLERVIGLKVSDLLVSFEGKDYPVGEDRIVRLYNIPVTGHAGVATIKNKGVEIGRFVLYPQEESYDVSLRDLVVGELFFRESPWLKMPVDYLPGMQGDLINHKNTEILSNIMLRQAQSEKGIYSEMADEDAKALRQGLAVLKKFLEAQYDVMNKRHEAWVKSLGYPNLKL